MKLEGITPSAMWNPDLTHTDVYRYTPDTKQIRNYWGQKGTRRRKEDWKRSSRQGEKGREGKGGKD